MQITPETRHNLLLLARKTIATELGIHFPQNPSFNDSVIDEKRGVFVTLTLDQKLRGCIGFLEAVDTVYNSVQNLALSAAFSDPRFPTLSSREFSQIIIEISILTPLHKISDPFQIRLGINGVVVEKGLQKGVFLPQVATDTGWSLEEFMDHLCEEKAFLPKNSWRSGEIDIYIFQVEKFSEK